ncbi:MAG: ferritin family protein [Bacillota bacterium]
MYEDMLENKIREAIRGQAAAIRYYSRLIRMLHNKRDQEQVEKYILNDEKRHIMEFREILRTLTGEDYNPEAEVKVPRHLDQAISQAINDELEAAELYKGIAIQSGEAGVKYTFASAMQDEMEHATRLTYLYAKNK